MTSSDAFLPWTRRTFLKAGAASGAALALGGWGLPFEAAGAAAEPLAPAVGAGLPLAQVAAVDDALRLWTYSFVSDPWVVGRVQGGADVARAAALLPGTPADAVGVLDGPRAVRAETAARFPEAPEAPEQTPDRVAFGLGWLAHHAAAAALGPPADADAALARDAAVFAGYLRPGADVPDAAAVEALYEAMWHRALVRLHTLKSDDTDVERWMHRYVAYSRGRTDVARRRAAAFASGRSAEPGFYDAADPVIEAARRLRLGRQREPIAYERLLRAPGESRYARAVAAAAAAFEQGAAYVAGDVDRSAVVGRLRP